ncbi:MAG: class I SAM-dependent methyltransferase [Lachnospiraceae bacterium]|nr:class I SAM-dependent methyltransferase [Lachnospiraceae bacterium]
MICKICGGKEISIIFDGQIRDGGLDNYTKENIQMFQCNCCKVIWHDSMMNLNQYYESTEYRESLEGTTDEETFYRLHDKETLSKLQYTGTEVFRNKTTADIGCGCGAFLDYVNGVASKVIAIEPSKYYRNIMDRKGFYTYPYAENAIEEWREKVDVITSFDVIEHVENPQTFLCECKELLKSGGTAIIGTPTDAPIMRELLGPIYEKKLLFSTQHLWIFSEDSLQKMARYAGFSSVQVKYFQRYGIGNLLGWIRERRAGSSIESSFLTDTMDAVWRKESEAQGLSDYIVLYVTK